MPSIHIILSLQRTQHYDLVGGKIRKNERKHVSSQRGRKHSLYSQVIRKEKNREQSLTLLGSGAGGGELLRQDQRAEQEPCAASTLRASCCQQVHSHPLPQLSWKPQKFF